MINIQKAIEENKLIDDQGLVFAINANKNLGFARANNLGAKFLINTFNVTQILFSNTDIEFGDDHVVDQLVKKIQHKIEKSLRKEFLITHITLQFEYNTNHAPSLIHSKSK